MDPRIGAVTIANRASAVELLHAQHLEHRITLSIEELDAAVVGLLTAPERGALLVAREGERTLGVAALAYTWTLEHGGLVAWLDELYVLPPRRGKGLGATLLAAACEHARRAGCVAIELEVDVEHASAERLYQRAGFEKLPRSRFSLSLARLANEPSSVTPAPR